MADTGWLLPGTAASVDRDSKIEWTNPDYAKTDDTNYASCAQGKNTYGDWLRLTNYGATITEGATINGFEIVVCHHTTDATLINDSALYLYANGQVGNNLASATKWPTTPTEASYGGASNMCGTTLTRDNVVATTFGIQLSSACGSIVVAAYVDYIKIKVYYTEGGGGVVLPVFMFHYMNH